MARESVRFAVLSDAHAMPPAEQPSVGADSFANLQRAVSRLNSLSPPVEFVIHLGDLTGEETREAYAAFAEATAGIQVAQFPVLGNHDDPALLAATVPTPNLVTPADAPDGYYSFEWRGLRVIVLNSRQEGQPEGHLDQGQICWLEAELGRRPDSDAVICVHHPPAPIGADWIDAHRVDQDGALSAVLSGAARVLAVFSGHVHGRYRLEVAGIPVEIAPSTYNCIDPEQRAPMDANQGFLVVDAGPEGLSTSEESL